MEGQVPKAPRFDGSGFRAAAVREGSTSSVHPLPSGEFPFPVHFDLLRRFMSVSRNGAEPVDPVAVEGQGIPPKAAQLNAPFLCDIGLLVEEKPGRFKPTPVSMQFINTQIANEDRGRRLLRSLIEKTWFGATAKALLNSARVEPFRDEDLMAALAAAAQCSPGRDERPLRVLTEYLVYTGILVRPDRVLSEEGPGSASSHPHPAGAVAPPAKRTGIRPPRPVNRSTQEAAWEIIQTSEFYVKIRPEPAAVRRLRRQLDLLDQKLQEGAEPETKG